MRNFTRIFFLFIMLIAIAGHAQLKENSPVIIEGKVIDDATGKPLGKIHVYITEGEEETLTNDKGEFRIESWQKFPIKLTVNSYTGSGKKIVSIQDASQKKTIRLKGSRTKD